MNSETQKRLISSYVNGTLKSDQIDYVESIIGSSESLGQFYLEKLEHKEFLKSLIPQTRYDLDSKRELEATIREINKDVFPKEKFQTLKKAYNFLTTPIIEI